MPASSSVPVARALVRSALRFARTANDVPFSLRAADVRAAAPSLTDVPSPLSGRDGVRAAVRAVARANAALTGDDASAALDAALAAVADLHTSTAAAVAAARAARVAHSGPEAAVAAPPGTVAVHKLFGYRFVVAGWDASCARGADWAASVGGDPASIWYSVLPDEGDCVSLFGAPRLSKYVAAANVDAAPPAARVTHRALRHFFDGWSPSLGRYVPNERLRFEFPAVGEGGGGDVPPDDVEAIDGDAGVLFVEGRA